MPRQVKRVLVYRLGSLGDMVVALPAFHLVERAFPHSERRLLTNFPVSGKAAAAEAILGGSGLFHHFVPYPAGTRNPWHLFQLWLRLLLWRPQVVVYLGSLRGLASAQRDARFFRFCGVAKQSIFGVPDTVEKQIPRWDAERELLEPEYSRLLGSIAELGDGQIDQRSSWDLRLSHAERHRAASVLQPAMGRELLCISLGTKVPANEWGWHHWSECIQRLGTMYPAFAFVLIGSADELALCDQAAAAWREGAGSSSITLNLCGQLTPRESAACLELARLFLGHDSGPLHLAAAAGAPCVAIFSARNLPGRWFPQGQERSMIYHRVSCMGCFLRVCVEEKMRCILSVSVDEVIEHVRAVLDTAGK